MTDKCKTLAFANMITSKASGITQQRGEGYGTPSNNAQQFQNDKLFIAGLIATDTNNEAWAVSNCATKLGRLRNLSYQMAQTAGEPSTELLNTFDDTVLDFVNYFLFACGETRKSYCG